MVLIVIPRIDEVMAVREHSSVDISGAVLDWEVQKKRAELDR